MTVWMQFHGGYAYHGFGEPEQFATLDDAVATFLARYNGHDSYFPTVDEGARGWIYFADPGDGVDVYPDRVIEMINGELEVSAA